MISRIAVYGFCCLNIFQYSTYALAAFDISAEEAASYGMTPSIYQSTAYLDVLMLLFSVAMAAALFLKREKLFIGAAWAYIGVFLFGAAFSTTISLELGNLSRSFPVYIYGLVSLAFVIWGPFVIRKETATNR